jgi:hypothetical protein
MLRLPFSPTSRFLCEEERGSMAAPKQLRDDNSEWLGSSSEACATL